MPTKKTAANGVLIHGFSDDPKEIIERIKSTATPLEMIDVRPGRAGTVFYYLRHQYVTDVLNALCAYDWDLLCVREYISLDHVQVLAEIVLRVEWHGRAVTIRKQHWGSADIKKWSSDGKGHKAGDAMSPGDDAKAALSDAKKKAAQELGLGADLSIPIRENTRKALHATGTKVFNTKEIRRWDDARPLIVRAVVSGRTLQDGSPITSSNDLLDIEARLAIAAMDKGHPDHDLPMVAALADLLRPAIAQLYKTEKTS